MLLAEMREGVAVGPSPTLADWLGHWLAVVAPRLRSSTLHTYARHCATLSRLLGQVRLRDLRASQIEAALLALPVGPHTVRGLRAVLRNALGLAVRDRLVADNAAALARLPPGPPRRQPPTTAEVRALLAALEGHRLQPLALLYEVGDRRRGGDRTADSGAGVWAEIAQLAERVVTIGTQLDALDPRDSADRVAALDDGAMIPAAKPSGNDHRWPARFASKGEAG